ncbi:MAG: nucleotide sugar dehydrogenase [Solirubrobacteraceae bacterium]
MTVGIVGLGYVGLPLAIEFAQAGTRVVGVDVNQARVADLAGGRSHIDDVPSDRLRSAADRIKFTSDYGDLAEVEAVLICVPTPLSVNREPELRPLLAASESLAGVLRRGQLVVLESTTYPRTTRETLVPILERSGLRAGEDFGVAFSPERVDPGRSDHTIRNTPKVVGGLTPSCGDRAERLYGTICDQVVRVGSPEIAELSKLLENIFRSVNIALVNELAALTYRMGIDVWEVVDAAATKPFGFMRFDPGPGMGGHCLPVDPFYLSWKAREFDFVPEFIELAGKINQSQPYFCAFRAVEMLNHAGKATRDARILLLGVAYKAGVADTRESPGLKLIRLLRARGADVAYFDPYVPELPELGLRGESDLGEALGVADLAVIVTAHPGVDHGRVVREAPMVLDLRGVTRGESDGRVQRL